MFATVTSDCIGCGTCEALCPQVFKMTDDGIAVAYTNPVPQDNEDSANEASTSCPVEAIILE